MRRWTRRICIALAVAAILISAPPSSRCGGDSEAMFEPGTTLLAASVLGLVSVVGLLALASRSRARTGGVWYPALALLLAVGLVVTIFRVDPDSYRPLLDQLGDYLLRETVGAVLLLVAVLGFIALPLLVRRRPSVAQLVLGGARLLRELVEHYPPAEAPRS
ncbi:hypothetical protein [Janibacter corallicola]|uniref:hypothetical protein n=1 Tax=Janibacter corallicola TaxID=415212 RepID=UPI00082EE80C|nr:hypothetical protein [Janibacter corallicola]